MSTIRNPSNYLQDIIDNALHIENFIAGQSKPQFMANLQLQYAVIRAFEIIGEATKHVPQEIRDSCSSIP